MNAKHSQYPLTSTEQNHVVSIELCDYCLKQVTRHISICCYSDDFVEDHDCVPLAHGGNLTRQDSESKNRNLVEW